MVKTISTEIKEKGKVSRGWIGISFSENEDGQVEVNDVEKDSPAELAKIQEGDILVSIEGKKVSGAPMVRSDIRMRKPGQDVKIELLREGKTVEAKVKLGEYPEAEARRELEMRFPRLFPAPPAAPAPPARGAAPMKPEKAPAPPRVMAERFGTWPGWEKRKYIGVYMESLNKEMLEFFGVKEESGLLVNRLTKDGPAEKAGIKVGDIVVRVNGKKVDTVGGLSELIQDSKKGDKVKLEIIRDKKPLTLEVEVSEEEGPSISYFFRGEPYRETWGEVSKELQNQYDLSRKEYEKYSETYRGQMKDLSKELLDQYQGSYGKAKGLYEDSKIKGKLRRLLSDRNRVIYRA